ILRQWVVALYGADAAVRTKELARITRIAALALAASYVVLLAVLRPFGIGVWPFAGQFTLAGRLHYALNAWPSVSMYAFNVWTLFGSAHHQSVTPDSQHAFGMSFRMWGALLFLVCYAY